MDISNDENKDKKENISVDDSKEKVSILDSDKEQIKDLAEQEVLSTKLVILFTIFVSLSIGIIAHAGYSVYAMLADKTIPVVVCPVEYNLDAPVVMKTIDKSSAKVTDRWIRGFMRRFITYQFPRKGVEAKPFFTYLANHSKDHVQLKYQELVDEIKQITDFIEGGFYYRFYPTDSKQMRISKNESSKNLWTVEIDGFLIKKMGNKEERYNPTLKYVVESGESNIDNPEGLYVIDANLEQITDYVSGNKTSL